MNGIRATKEISTVGKAIIQARVAPGQEIDHDIPSTQSLEFMHVQTIDIATTEQHRINKIFPVKASLVWFLLQKQTVQITDIPPHSKKM